MKDKNIFKLDETGCLSQEDTKKYYSRIGFFYLILAGTTFIVSLLSEIAIINFFPWVLNDGITRSLVDYAISFIGIYLIATPLATIALKPLPRMAPLKEKMRFKHLFAALCICFSFMLTGSYFSQYLQMFAEMITGKTLSNPVEQTLSTGSIIINALFVGILFPILEELLFRKLLCNKLLPLGEMQAVVISALIFGFIHGNIFQFAYAFLIGLVFGYVYVKSGKIIYSIIFHCALNLFTGIFANFAVSNPSVDIVLKMLEDETLLYKPELLAEMIEPYIMDLIPFLIYSYVLMGFSIAGFIIFFIITLRRKITFEQGILPPQKEHSISNFFLTGGVACAIAFIAFKFIISIMV